MTPSPRIAVMLMVHNNEAQVNRLIGHLSADFDVYVHVDKRVSLRVEARPNVFVYKKYKTYWGSFNLVTATLYLLREAFKKQYDRYILISGQDLPLKTNEEIKAFFKDNQTEYLDMAKVPTSGVGPTLDRLTTYHLDFKFYDRKHLHQMTRFFAKILKVITKPFPRKIDYEFYGGSQWFAFTHNCLGKIFEYLEKDKKYVRRFWWTHCSDEIFFQTILHQLDGLTIEKNSLRYVDWRTGPEGPRILREEDFEKIMADGRNLFARKFDARRDSVVIEMIYREIADK
jgi:hypothetical protein